MTSAPRSAFAIDVPPVQQEELARRLRATRFPAACRGDWSEGTSIDYLRELIEDWASFDWRSAQRSLNELPQVMVELPGGHRIHAVHRRGVGPDPMPLLLTHGWPSCFAEYQHVTDMLADPASHGGDPADAFHVVAASLPGFAFSPAAEGRTPSVAATARLWVELMTALGYPRFGAHGSDWGSLVTALLGANHPDSLLGIHMGALNLRSAQPRARTEDERRDLDRYAAAAAQWRSAEHAYQFVQATKPQSLAFAVADSPAGMAAWLVEKYRSWSDCGGDLHSAIPAADLLTVLSIFWYTNSAGSANRIYAVNPEHAPVLEAGRRVEVPAGFMFQRSLPMGDPRAFLDVPRAGAPPRALAEDVFDIRRWTVTSRGGHFPALEVPEVFVDEIRAFFRDLRPA